jgi:predicted hexulose-6-phosphate isomerase
MGFDDMKDFNGCKIGVYEKALPDNLSFLDRLLIVMDAGYDFLEMSIDETEGRMSRLDWPRDKKLELVKAVHYSGIPILTMYISGNRRYPIGSQNTEIREKGLSLIKKAIDLAVDIGLRIIQVAGYDEYYNESNKITRRLFFESLQRAVSYAAENGVMLALRNVETPFLDSIEKISQCAGYIGSPYLQLYPDIGSLTATGHSVFNQKPMFHRNIVGFRLKDACPGIMRDVPLGQGTVDFPGFFQEMSYLNFGGFYTAEMPAAGEPAPAAYIAAAREFLAAQFREAHARREKVCFSG